MQYKTTTTGLYVPLNTPELAELTPADLGRYRAHLIAKGKATSTVEKYSHDAEAFLLFLGNRHLSAGRVREYISSLQITLAATTINCIIAAINGLLKLIGRTDCTIDPLKVEKKEYVDESRFLTDGEIRRLIAADDRMATLIQTIVGTGVRVSELKFFTVESVRTGVIPVANKGKRREVILHKDVRRLLMSYCRRKGITSGPIFRSRAGAPLFRGYIWMALKRLCARAGVEEDKVFPHALRHAFAVRLYRLTKDLDLVRKALGHRRVDTTLIYTAETRASSCSAIPT